MLTKCYPVQCDISPVIPGLAVDLNKAYNLGQVPAHAAIDPQSFNGISNPEDIVGRPSDAFEAARVHAAYLEKAIAASKSNDVESDPPAPSTSTE